MIAEGKQLASFARFTDRSGYRGPITRDVASRWALASRQGRRITAAHRIEVLRGFARYCQNIDQRSDVVRRGTPSPHTAYLFRCRDWSISAGRRRTTSGQQAARHHLRNDTGTDRFLRAAYPGSRWPETHGCRSERGAAVHSGQQMQQLSPRSVVSDDSRALRDYVHRRDRDPLAARSDAFFVFDARAGPKNPLRLPS